MTRKGHCLRLVSCDARHSDAWVSDMISLPSWKRSCCVVGLCGVGLWREEGGALRCRLCDLKQSSINTMLILHLSHMVLMEDCLISPRLILTLLPWRKRRGTSPSRTEVQSMMKRKSLDSDND